LRDAGLPLPRPEALERLVYVVGPARGGTSIISHAIGVHDAILEIPHDYHFVDQVWPYRNKLHNRLWRIVALLPEFCNEKSIAEKFSESEQSLIRLFIDSCIKSKQYYRLLTMYPSLFCLWGLERKVCDDVKIWKMKDNTWRGMKDIKAHLPLTRFVFVTRDPRACVHSAAKRMGRLSGEVEDSLSKADIVQGSIYWMMMAEICQRFARHNPDDCHFVRYEDFLEDPEAVVLRIYEFLGEDTLGREEVSQRMTALVGGATNNPHERYTGISSAPKRRWEANLSSSELDIIESITGKSARKLGYEIVRSINPWKLLQFLRYVPSLGSRVAGAVKVLGVHYLGFIVSGRRA